MLLGFESLFAMGISIAFWRKSEIRTISVIISFLLSKAAREAIADVAVRIFTAETEIGFGNKSKFYIVMRHNKVAVRFWTKITLNPKI